MKSKELSTSTIMMHGLNAYFQLLHNVSILAFSPKFDFYKTSLFFWVSLSIKSNRKISTIAFLMTNFLVSNEKETTTHWTPLNKKQKNVIFQDWYIINLLCDHEHITQYMTKYSQLLFLVHKHINSVLIHVLIFCHSLSICKSYYFINWKYLSSH